MKRVALALCMLAFLAIGIHGSPFPTCSMSHAAEEAVQATAATQGFWDWLLQNWALVVPWVLYVASEIIGLSPLKSNTTVQFVLALLGKAFTRPVLKLLLFLTLALSLVACGGTTVLKTAQVTKEAAESALYEARTLQNKNIITADQFEEVRTAYDALKAAQDTLIDAREAYLASPTQDNKTALTSAVTALARESTALIDTARKYNVGGGVLWQ